MQYIVQVNGDVLDKQSKAYVVKAASEEDAQIIATQNFCKEFVVEKDEVHVSVKPQRRSKTAIVAFVFLLIPILLSFVQWKNGHDTVSISPDYISCLFGVLIYSAFVVRFKGIKRVGESWIDIVFCVLLVLVLSTFVRTILVEKNLKFFGNGEFTVDTTVLLVVATILSWFGLKVISLISMCAVTVIALFNIVSLNNAMGFFGSVYMICAFVGILLYLAVEPALPEIISQIRYTTKDGYRYLSSDISLAKESVVNVTKALSKRIQNSDKKDGKN